jgi:aspartate racemase
MSKNFGIVGVLGGMGPLATVDFLRKVLDSTPAHRDQDHVPLVICSIPQIPDRTAAFRGAGESPLEAMVEIGRKLKTAGANLVVVPCNTAHLWYDEVEAALQLPMLHMVDAAVKEVVAAVGSEATVGLLATDATLASGMYPNRGARACAGLQWIQPTAVEMLESVMPGIEAVKAGRLDEGRWHLATAAQALRRRGAQAIVMGCTEIPVVLDADAAGVPVFDPTAALARAAVDWSLGNHVFPAD